MARDWFSAHGKGYFGLPKSFILFKQTEANGFVGFLDVFVLQLIYLVVFFVQILF